MKKFTAFLLIFSLMMLSANLYAKEKRGAKLLITKKDGQQIKGELITVKPNSLLLLDTEGKDVSIDIEDIKVIRIVKKLGVMWGALGGLLGGGMVGGAFFWWFPGSLHMVVLAGAAFGAIISGIVGAFARADKKIQIEGMTDSEIQKTLDKLSKKARIRDYK